CFFFVRDSMMAGFKIQHQCSPPAKEPNKGTLVKCQSPTRGHSSSVSDTPVRYSVDKITFNPEVANFT
ncbi:hypothetical protein ACJMK2_041892, partial [Sinanodonta woodiana]